MRIVQVTGNIELARVFTAETDDGSLIEFVESVQRPKSREDKWVLIVSTLKGCPVKCPICDAGGHYRGKLTKEEILAQIEHLIRDRFPNGRALVNRLKIQFARMGDPVLNSQVLDVLEELPVRLPNTPVQPSISTVAPAGSNTFLEKMAEIKNRLYPNGWFQMQFSVHTTCDIARRKLIPIKTWTMSQIAEFGKTFVKPGDLKISLNFAPAEGFPFSTESIGRIFSPELFCIKLTPINPTASASESKLKSIVDPDHPELCEPYIRKLKELGFETILSIGDLEENAIGSNCGMFVNKLKEKDSAAL